MAEPPQLSATAREMADRMSAVVLLCILAWVVPFLLDILVDFAGRLLDQPQLVRRRSVFLVNRTLGLLLGLLAVLRVVTFYRAGRHAFLAAIGSLVVTLALAGYLYLGLQEDAVHIMGLAAAGALAAGTVTVLAFFRWLFAPPPEA